MKRREIQQNERWWRASAYVVNNGRIAPAVGARVREYAPKAKQFSRQRTQDWQPAYVGLAEVVEKFDGARPCAQQALLDWCRDHGLLGLLPHRLAVYFGPVGHAGVPTVTTRSGSVWRAFEIPDHHLQLEGEIRHLVPGDDEEVGSEAEVFEPVSVAVRNPTVALVTSLDGEATELVDANTLFETYFARRSAPDTTPLPPLPLSPEFWLSYGEPVEEFVDAARMLVRAAKLLRADPSRTGRDLAALVGGAHPVLTRDGSRLVLGRWATPSLLAALAIMVLDDAARGNRVLTCAHCEAWFTSARGDARFCSRRHAKAFTERKRRNARKAGANRTKRS